jgi:hypothetical protein
MQSYQQLVQQLRASYPGTQDREAHLAWQNAVYREAQKVQEVEREVFVSMCLAARASTGSKAA